MHASHPIFHTLRSAMLRRLLGIVCLLGMAAAYASLVIAPRSMDVLCSTNGVMKLISQTTNGEQAESNADAEHCGLCANTSAAAPPSIALAPIFSSALAYATQRTTASALAALTRPPLPARGPPVFS